MTTLVSLALRVTAATAHAQVPVAANLDHEAMLHHGDPQLAKNKRLVFDFWREVFEAAHMDLAPKYMAETYIQHNPRVPTGRQAFIDFFSRVRTPAPIEPRVKAPLVAILNDPARKYTTTWFDMFRIVDGKIAEHWDPATKP